jgi:hypothetical protein
MKKYEPLVWDIRALYGYEELMGMFTKRENDELFAEIGRLAGLRGHPAIWFGYEIVQDSQRLSPSERIPHTATKRRRV